MLLSHAAEQLIQTCAIVKLIKQAYEEVDVACRIYEMPTRAFELRSPDLDSESFGEDLRKLLFGSKSSRSVALLVIENMRSLEVKLAYSNALEFVESVETHLGTHAVMPVGLVCTLELLENFHYIRIPSLQLLRCIDFTGPWDRLQSLASLRGLPKSLVKSSSQVNAELTVICPRRTALWITENSLK